MRAPATTVLHHCHRFDADSLGNQIFLEMLENAVDQVRNFVLRDSDLIFIRLFSAFAISFKLVDFFLQRKIKKKLEQVLEEMLETALHLGKA